MAALSSGSSLGGTTAELGPVECWTDREIVEELCRIKAARPPSGHVHPWIRESCFVASMAKRVIHYNQKLSPAMREKAEQILRGHRELTLFASS